MRWADGRLGVYPLGAWTNDAVAYGGDLRAVLRRLDGEEARAPLEVAGHCSGGVHLDEASRHLDFWLAAPEPEARERAARRWPGWDVVWHQDDFASQALAGGRLVFRVPPEAELLDAVVRILDLDPGGHRGQRAAEIGALLAADGTTVESNPDALFDAPQSVPPQTQERILAQALAAFAAARASRR